MNPRIKRLLSLLLALTMVFSLTTPVSASAASTTAASSNTVEIEVGETAKLKVSGVYSKTTWTSSDEAVATVSSNGTVTGVAPGTATITAVSKSYFSFWGGNKTTKFTVIVTEPEEALTVKAGETLQLEIETIGGTVTWKSSNKSIATVDANGLVTGVSEGDVTITATEKKTTGNKFLWFFWWGSGKTTTTVTEFEVTVLPGDEEPTDPPVTEPPVAYYTVTFESNGGSEVDPQTIEEGLVATEPEAPTMDGYTFGGWYIDAELTEAYDFATPVTTDITLYAAWESIPVEPEIPTEPPMPENPSAADEYYWNNSHVIEVKAAEESSDVLTETDVKALLEERGFVDYPITYSYSIDGEYAGETEVTDGSEDKHPMYQTIYIAESGDVWVIYVIDGMIFANPLSFKFEMELDVEYMFSEAEMLTSYDDASNKFYVTIPDESAVIVKTVDRIDAETLDSLTIEVISEL